MKSNLDSCRVAIITDQVNDFNLAQLFMARSNIEVEIFSFHEQDKLGYNAKRAKLRLFEKIEDMPGYMRDLSHYLNDFDLLVVTRPERLSAFQAMSASKCLGIPLWTVMNRPPSSKDLLEEQAAVMLNEVLSASQKLFYSNRDVRDFFHLFDDLTGKICQLPRLIVSERVVPTERNRIRKLLKVTEDKHLVFCPSVRDSSVARKMLFVFRDLKSKNPLYAQKFVLLIAGLQNAEDLQSLVVEFKLVDQLLFLAQDIDGMMSALLAASDIFVSEEKRERLGFESLVEKAFKLDNKVIVVENDKEDYLKFIPNIRQKLEEAGEQLADTSISQGNQQQSPDETTMLTGWYESLGKIERAHNKRVHKSSQQSEAEFQALKLAGKLSEALDVITAICKEDSMSVASSGKVYEEKGLLHLQLGHLEEATAAFDKALSFDKGLWRSYLGLAKISVLSHSEEEAAKFFRKVLSLKPNHAEALAGIGTVYRVLGMPEESLYWLAKSFSLDTSNRSILLALTQASLQCEDLKKSYTTLVGLRQQIGDERSVLIALGQTLKKMGHDEEGRALIQKAIDADAQETAIDSLS